MSSNVEADAVIVVVEPGSGRLDVAWDPTRLIMPLEAFQMDLVQTAQQVTVRQHGVGTESGWVGRRGGAGVTHGIGEGVGLGGRVQTAQQVRMGLGQESG